MKMGRESPESEQDLRGSDIDSLTSSSLRVGAEYLNESSLSL
jgi:hypothetical protein